MAIRIVWLTSYWQKKEEQMDVSLLPNSSGEWIRDPETGARIPPLLPENEDLNKGKQLLEEEANCSRGYSTCNRGMIEICICFQLEISSGNRYPIHP